MAIAYDNSADATTTGNVSQAYTCTGSNLILLAFASIQDGNFFSGTPTYNGVSMTQIDDTNINGVQYRNWYLLAPATGSNTFALTISGSHAVKVKLASYSGVAQSGQPDNHTTNSTSNTTMTTSLTTVADNCWTVIVGCNDRAPTASTNTTQRQNANNQILGDSNGVVHPAGSFSMSITQSDSSTEGWLMVSIKPFTSTAFTRSLSDSIMNAVLSSTPTIIDSYSESNHSYNEASGSDVGSGVQNFVGQSFLNVNVITLNSCKFNLEKLGSPTGNINAEIYAHTGTYGVNGVPTGSALATSDNFDISTISGVADLYTFNFSGSNRITLSANTNYVVVLHNTHSELLISGDTTSPTASGVASFSTDGITWTILNHSGTNEDLCFYIYGVLQSRLATVSFVKGFVRALSDSIMNGASRSTTVARSASYIRSASVSIMNAASRLVTLGFIVKPIKGFMQMRSRENINPISLDDVSNNAMRSNENISPLGLDDKNII